jgi:YD repeat-containing protein
MFARLQNSTTDVWSANSTTQPLTTVGGSGTPFCGVTPGDPAIQYASLAWGIDAFGNRSRQTATGHIPPQNTPGLTFNNAQNHADQFVYDGAGDVTNDGSNQYLYDAEGRICAMRNSIESVTGYLYDSEGRRVAKGSLSNFSCDLNANGFALTESTCWGKPASNWLQCTTRATGSARMRS